MPVAFSVDDEVGVAAGVVDVSVVCARAGSASTAKRYFIEALLLDPKSATAQDGLDKAQQAGAE